jgi:hypothetical protein
LDGLHIASRSVRHFVGVAVSRRSRAAIATYSLSPFRRFANSLCRTGSEAGGEFEMMRTRLSALPDDDKRLKPLDHG